MLKGIFMKNIVKQLVIFFALGLFIAPVMAAETTKGTKSYQAQAEKTAETAVITPEEPKAEDAAKIAPAAGEAQDAEPAEQGKSWKEEMRLPRKN
jgi:hypothetical protein